MVPTAANLGRPDRKETGITQIIDRLIRAGLNTVDPREFLGRLQQTRDARVAHRDHPRQELAAVLSVSTYRPNQAAVQTALILGIPIKKAVKPAVYYDLVEPLDHPGIGVRLGPLGDNVRVQQKAERKLK